MISFLVNIYQRKKSIRKMLKLSYQIIISVMAIPTVVLIFTVLIMISRYNHTVKNIDTATELQRVLSQDLTKEVWDIISGKQSFSQGQQYEFVGYAKKQMEKLFNQNQNAVQYIVAAQRANDTLEKYLDQLGEQIASNAAVTYNEEIYWELISVVNLSSDVLQQYVQEEITVIADQNNNIQTAAVAISVLVAGLLLLVLAFAIASYRNLEKSIHTPIMNLEKMAARIAEGDLMVRATFPQVEELEPLTRGLNDMAGRLCELIEEQLAAQQALQKSEMRTLQAQITPHFVYNTFETIIWLAENNRTREIVDITMAFTDFFRISLSQGLDYITVEKETQHVCSYLSIQSVRYGSSMTYEIDIADALKDFFILKLLLQPLVENAIYHGTKLKRGRGHIVVAGWQNPDHTMTFQVTDDGLGMTPEKLEQLKKNFSGNDPSEGKGFGLFNVNQRIRLYYGGQGLNITSEYEKGTCVSFTLPCKEERYA